MGRPRRRAGNSPQGTAGFARIAITALAVSIIATLLAGCASAQSPVGAEGSPVVIPFEVWDSVRVGGARVIVELRVPGGIKPEAELGDAESVAVQHRAIAAVQNQVLARLSGTSFALVRRYTTVPFLALEIRADALKALEAMGDLVTRLFQDTPARPSSPGRMPR